MKRTLSLPRRKTSFASELVKWYEPNRRPFPWRNEGSVYIVAVCEIMLQRTNAEKVLAISNKLIKQYPTPSTLANASLLKVRKILKPLGLAKKVHQIQEVATVLSSKSKDHIYTDKELQALPGIGPYCSAAIRILVQNDRDTLIDEHVLRIFRRVFEINAPPRRHPTKSLRSFANSLLPRTHVREYNLALLDLGRLICRPQNPFCLECPLNRICKYALRNI